jgi:soluble lytic murein transglycosylase-like protein
MRSNTYSTAQIDREISAKTTNGYNLFYCLAGSIGLLIISTQFSYFAADKLQFNNEQTARQQSQLPSHATPAKNATPMVPAKSGIDAETSAPLAVCEKEPGKIADALSNLDPEIGSKLASHVESRYKVSASTARQIVSTTISLSRKNDMDPYLALGIIASESSFNHKAKSGYGATGLMQIYAPIHKNVLEDLGIRSKDPKVIQKVLAEQIPLNVAAGIRIYKTYEKQYGSRKKALQAYNGAKQDTSYAYANKVLAMQEQLRQVAPPANGCA